ncbi:MAG: DMT family transporter, partial [Actinobacteria bacterium]|nr:DMT family transporter [Actinomycetota bacterium]
PLWLLGYAADWGGYGLQAVALGAGSLLVVQPLLVTGLLFSLPIAARWSGRRLERTDWIAAVALCAGLAAFLSIGNPTGGRDQAPFVDWAFAGGIVAGVGVLLVMAALRYQGATRATLLALATGISYGLTAGLTKTSVNLLGNGIVSFLTHWEPYALLAFASVGMWLNQTAFQVGDLKASLPAMDVGEQVVAAVIGVAVLREHVQAHGAFDWLLIAVALTAMAYGVVVLSVRAADTSEPVAIPGKPIP